MLMRNVVDGFRSGNSLGFSKPETRPVRKRALSQPYSMRPTLRMVKGIEEVRPAPYRPNDPKPPVPRVESPVRPGQIGLADPEL